MDTVGYLLAEVEPMLQAQKIRYAVKQTFPTRDFFKVDDSQLYIIRQTMDAAGGLQLIVAAKMRKEVSEDGL